MRAITIRAPGGPDVLQLTEVPDPVPTPEQLLVRVQATALNRADTLQRRGHYPPPPGESEILGLELAGEVEAVGSATQGFRVGDRVFGLVGGGGYAEKAVIDYRMAMLIPTAWSCIDAAAVPEVFLTANETLFTLGQLAPGETVLIHAGASGVGTAGIQMARHLGARVFATAGTPEKVARITALGADVGINYKTEDFAARVRELTQKSGVALVQDFIGAAYWQRNLQCLAAGGRLVLVGLMGGTKIEADLGLILRQRLHIIGSVMRSQSLDNKIAMTQRFQERWLPLLAQGHIRPIIDTTFPLAEAAAAHQYMEENRNVGKIMLRVD
ncbi:MAG: NAD(P)H-quinone oxidoreductase [Candidatus Tectomicrobia bacterium]|uniref:NAD(P)H-quinone oxidoreductase n=1 Tax=Tectimicrobiota bacterium TaxID=2528274 RepID=A0A938B6J2_UNCTE|nr:NAD(P)H-quinone oxidoreductase [Candidatus Tectomicrobia bacterium]